MRNLFFVTSSVIVLFILIMINKTITDDSTPRNDSFRINRAQQHVAETIRFANEQYGLLPYARGGGYLDNKVTTLGIHFYGVEKKPVTVDRAREIYVNVAEYLLDKCNHDEELQPYLLNGRLSINELDFDLIFNDDSNNFRPAKEGITFVSVVNEIIRFKSEDKVTERYITIFSQPYDEAFQIIREKKQTISEDQPGQDAE